MAGHEDKKKRRIKRTARGKPKITELVEGFGPVSHCHTAIG